MSTKYTGGFITKSPVAPTTSAASGIWTLDQQQQAKKADTWPSPPIFIEDLFSCFLYTGNGSTQTITNGIDLAGKGGLVWAKSRSDIIRNSLFDTARGANFQLSSNNTESSANVAPNGITFNSTGFTTGSFVNTNTNGSSYVSWTFAKQPKFFDIVTYTGNGVFDRAISHNLGAVPAVIIIKCTNTLTDWLVRTTAIDGSQDFLFLNKTDAKSDSSISNTWSTTTFTVGASALDNDIGNTYVAYLFASNAGGFPVSGGGSTNGITCGTYTGTGSPFNVELGYEPQWVLVKKTSATGDWILMDTMRGMSITTSQWLYPNLDAIESDSGAQLNPTATGFTVTSSGSGLNGGGATYIYIAIRRGPMKVPTLGTSVFSPNSVNGSTGQVVTTNFAVDSQIWNYTNGTSLNSHVYDRLRGISSTTTESGQGLVTSSTAAEVTDGYVRGWNNTGFQVPSGINGAPVVYYNFVRAPGFFDEVCYTGTGVATTFNHNLGVVPELMIVKCRSDGGTSQFFWCVYVAPLGNTANLVLSDNSAIDTGNQIWNNTTPTSSVFSVFNTNRSNALNKTYVAYLFATCAGVSKVGSYTGTGALQTVNCGFTGGARFVLIKRTDSTGNWWVYDSARGITSGNDPYLYLNTTAAEVTGTNYVDTDSTGFKVTAAAPAELNANGGTYIFLAIA